MSNSSEPPQPPNQPSGQPPGTPPEQPPEQPSQPSASSPSPFLGAAVACWVAGGLEVVVFGCCAAGMLLAGTASPAQVQQADLPQGVTPDLVVLAARWMAAALMVVMVVPGLVLLYLGFAVRQGRSGPMLAASIILIVQAALLGVIALLSIAGSVMTGDLLGGLLNLVLFGGLSALLIWAALRVWAARGGPGGPAGRAGPTPDDEEPWNSHLGSGRGW